MEFDDSEWNSSSVHQKLENDELLIIASSDRPNPVSAEPNHFFAELCSAEPNGSAKVRPIWPNLFGHICRTCSAVFAEHVRPYLPKVFGRSTTRQPTVKFTYLLIINKYQYVLFLPNCLVLIWLSTQKNLSFHWESRSSALCSSHRPALISNNSLQTLQCFILLPPVRMFQLVNNHIYGGVLAELFLGLI